MHDICICAVSHVWAELLWCKSINWYGLCVIHYCFCWDLSGSKMTNFELRLIMNNKSIIAEEWLIDESRRRAEWGERNTRKWPYMAQTSEPGLDTVTHVGFQKKICCTNFWMLHLIFFSSISSLLYPHSTLQPIIFFSTITFLSSLDNLWHCFFFFCYWSLVTLGKMHDASRIVSLSSQHLTHWTTQKLHRTCGEWQIKEITNGELTEVSQVAICSHMILHI